MARLTIPALFISAAVILVPSFGRAETPIIGNAFRASALCWQESDVLAVTSYAEKDEKRNAAALFSALTEMMRCFEFGLSIEVVPKEKTYQKEMSGGRILSVWRVSIRGIGEMYGFTITDRGPHL